MNFFGKRQKRHKAAVQTVTSTNINSSPLDMLNHYSPISIAEIKLYSVLKEAVPIIDAAISKIVRLVGEFSIKCEDNEVSYMINRFVRNVQVNAYGQGLNTFITSYLNQVLTFGTAVGEIVVDGDGGRIKALYNSSLSNVELQFDNSPLKLKVYRKDEKGQLHLIKYPELILVSALNPDAGNIYGNSIMKGLPFISDILLGIYKSIGANWERIGNVRFAVTYKPSADAGEKAYAKERAIQIANEWSKTMKRGGTPSDFVAVGDVDIKVIGADNQVLDSQVPVRQMLEQIVSKLSIPPFLLGLSWSSTERMSTQQADILTSELEAYRRMLNPIILKICNVWMRLNGYQCDISIDWENINLQDEVQLANARLMDAKAREIEKKLEKNL